MLTLAESWERFIVNLQLLTFLQMTLSFSLHTRRFMLTTFFTPSTALKTFGVLTSIAKNLNSWELISTHSTTTTLLTALVVRWSIVLICTLVCPLNGKQNTTAFWNPIVEKVETRLSTWGSSHLSKGGRNSHTYYFEQPPYLLLCSI